MNAKIRDLIRGGVQISRSDKQGTRVNPNEGENGRVTKSLGNLAKEQKSKNARLPLIKQKQNKNTRAGSIVPYARGRVLDRYVQYRYISLVCL